MAKKDDFKYEIIEIVRVLEENNNWGKVLMRVSWNDGPIVYDIRNIDLRTMGSLDEVVMRRGISLSDQALNTLLEVLIDEGFGNTKKLIKKLKKRDDIFGSQLKTIYIKRIKG